jgi:hypothetical protein
VSAARLGLAGLACLLACGCYDPFAPAEAEAPTSSSSGVGAATAAQVPSLFGNALDSADSDRIPVLVSDSVQMVDGTSVQTYSKLHACAVALEKISAPLTWNMGAVSRTSSSGDTVVETFDYSLYRSGARLAHATARWTVARDVYWTLVRWEEDAADSGWTALCKAPR